MRWLGRVAVLAGVAAVMACQSSGSPLPAQVAGAHSLTLADDLLFITATDRNELRVIDLSADPVYFVPAPNPLHPLSIPVADRPVALAGDVIWKDGQRSSGPWVYALSANGQEISIVGTSRESLKEERRLPRLNEMTPEGASAPVKGTITAIAARGSSDENAPSTLYFAAFDGKDSHIFALQVPRDISDLKVSPTVVVTEPAATIRSLLVAPGEDAIAYSYSPTDAAPAGGPIAKLRQGATETILQFAYPVRMLFTHESMEGLQAGTFLFGVYDEQSCGGAAVCRGVSAVIGVAGQGYPRTGAAPCGQELGAPACDTTGYPMPTISMGDALVMGADIAQGAPLPQINGQPAPDATGILTTSDGRIVYIDARHLAPLDIDGSGPVVTEVTVAAGPGGQVPAGVAANATGVVGIELADGAARTDTVAVTYGGALPGLYRIPYAPDAVTTDAIAVPVDPADLVQVGDVVQLTGPAECTGEMVVTGITSAPGAHRIQVATRANVGSECLMTVRAAHDGASPWVVTGTAVGYMGRIASSATSFAWPAPDAERTFSDPNPAYPWDLRLRQYYAHPAGFGEVNGEIPPAVRFSFVNPLGTAQPDPSWIGLRYVFRVDGHYNPASSTIALPGVGTVLRVDVAGTVVYRPEGQKMYVTFPSGHLLLEIAASDVVIGGGIEKAEDFR